MNFSYMQKYFWIFFQEERKISNYKNRHILCFKFLCQKLWKLFRKTDILIFSIDLSKKPYQSLWFNQTQPPLFQNISNKNYQFFLKFQGVITSKLKIYKLKWDTECISCKFAAHVKVIPIATTSLFLAEEVKKGY